MRLRSQPLRPATIAARLGTAALVALGALNAPPSPAQTRGAAPAPSDSARAAAASYARASWLTTRVPLRVGDAVTVLVDESTAARERVSRVAVGDRSSRNTLDAGFDSGGGSGTQMAGAFRAGSDNRSRDEGEAGRRGDLTGVLTARVVEITPEGLARVRGTRTVSVDGRKQVMSLEGLVRPEDVSTTNEVFSSRMSDATIDLKGKAIGPKRSFFGRLLGMLWP